MDDEEHTTTSDAAQYFQQHPGAQCPECEYVLAGLTVWRCPECGTQLAPGELLEEGAHADPLWNPQLRWDHVWLVGCGFWLVVLFTGLLARGFELERENAVGYAVQGVLVLAAPVSFLVAGVSRVIRGQRDAWRGLAVGVWVVSPVMMVLGAWVVREVFSMP